MDLTARQTQILRWLDENPSNRARWLVDGREPLKGPSSAWTHMEVSGPAGSILIASADNKALHSFVAGCPTKDKIYGITDEARQMLEQERAVQPETSASLSFPNKSEAT